MFLLLNKLKRNYPIFREPVEPNPYLAAVMVVIYEKRGKNHIILIRRSYDLKNHAGEIAFPGGKYEEKDGDLLETARRETQEELNFWIKEPLVIGRLHSVTTLTGFNVAPFVAFIDYEPVYNPNNLEVDEVLDIPLIPLLETQSTGSDPKNSIEMVKFYYKDSRIWGATAKILYQLAKLKTI
tara:strand:- start:266 stop:811 length:546 start_codon:yes stop_codon:yes gene_type:complete